jgi:hypothetical protein
MGNQEHAESWSRDDALPPSAESDADWWALADAAPGAGAVTLPACEASLWYDLLARAAIIPTARLRRPLGLRRSS